MRKSALCVLWLSLILLLSVIPGPHVSTANANNTSKMGPTLGFLLTIREQDIEVPPESELWEIIDVIEQTQIMGLHIEFDREISLPEIEALESLGVEFHELNGEIAHIGNIYGAAVPCDEVTTLAELPYVVRIESMWKPGVAEPLDVSIPAILADQVWAMTDGLGRAVTGKGVRIANFDSGIDVFHPDFWNADGGTYGWIDSNITGSFEPGMDHVDVNGNLAGDANELLRFVDATSVWTPLPPGTGDGVFAANMDWLYNDANSNGVRDYGTGSGYAESTPTYGERLFLVDDTDGDNALDVGESLIALGTSKVFEHYRCASPGFPCAAIAQTTRGVDLISTPPDTVGHGTGVSGILVGGVPSRRRYVGVAPGSELLVADVWSFWGFPSMLDFTRYIPWAESRGAKVMLYEYGFWVQQFLDGSSLHEKALDTEAAKGIVQVVPAGNLAGGMKHMQTTIPATSSTSTSFNVPAWPVPTVAHVSVLWRNTGNDLTLDLTSPTPVTVNLPGTTGGAWSTLLTADGHTVMHQRLDSSRGTALHNIAIMSPGGLVSGGWSLQINNVSSSPQLVDAYLDDDVSVWSGGPGLGTYWTSFVSDRSTVTVPATADSAITVASYSTRGFGGATTGSISLFSGRGPRVDGQAIVDIAAPGNHDVVSAESKDQYGPPVTLGRCQWFGGTSAAGPHVAGAAALMLQNNPSLAYGQVKQAIQHSAIQDGFTGTTPNNAWGYGKLDAQAATLATMLPANAISLPLIVKSCNS